jgi:NADH dehydrogenase/NADH:ubiquinone oxidoreductase subunit G
MEEMSRCIQCTRCVRFGQEVAGVMEFGMVGRGEHSEITTFVGKTVDSEVSGNMIDLCPVGALTSKPFRYSARPWELQRRKSVSPHDSLGSNLIVQVKGGKVMRVLPLENEHINECWLSDKDRFSYEALDNAERLVKPMLKQDGKWIETDWQTALEYVAHGMRNIRHEHGADSIAAVGTRTRPSKNCSCCRRPCAASASRTSTSACARATSRWTAPSSRTWACRSPNCRRSSACWSSARSCARTTRWPRPACAPPSSRAPS